MRSLDQLYLRCVDEQRVALSASDGRVAYRTSAALISEYSAREVARVLQADFAEHGAPLVLRTDNIPREAGNFVR